MAVLATADTGTVQDRRVVQVSNLAGFGRFDTRPSPARWERCLVYITVTRVRSAAERGLAESLPENTHARPGSAYSTGALPPTPNSAVPRRRRGRLRPWEERESHCRDERRHNHQEKV